MKLSYKDYYSLVKKIAWQTGFDLYGISLPEIPDFFQEQFSKQEELSYPEDLSWLKKHLPIKKNPALFNMGFPKSISENLSNKAETSNDSNQQNKLVSNAQSPKSIIVLGQSYYQGKERGGGNSILARISKYAWGRDYHKILKKKAKHFVKLVQEEFEFEKIQTRILVDTSPLSEKVLATNAGLGWMGKNTLIINKKFGSQFFICLIVNNIDLSNIPEESIVRNHCGNCSLCVDACPTSALSPYSLHIEKCISYMTIEQKSLLSSTQLEQCKPWVFGCDICQDVCPFNNSSKQVPALDFPVLKKWKNLSVAEFKTKLQQDDDFLNGTVLKRSGGKRLLQRL